MDKDWQSGNTKRIEKYKIDTWGIRLQNTCLLVWFSVALGSWETLELNFKFDRFIFHKLQELVAKRQISRDPLSGSDLAPSADSWGSLALWTEAERAADQEKQPWPRCRLWQLWPGKTQLTILPQMFTVGLLCLFSHPLTSANFSKLSLVKASHLLSCFCPHLKVGSDWAIISSSRPHWKRLYKAWKMIELEFRQELTSSSI